MKKSSRKRGLSGTILLLSLLPGCLNFCHPVPCPIPEQIEICNQLPKECRAGIYVFLFNGADPLEYANLSGVRDYLNQLGYIKTYYGQVYHCDWFAEEMCKLHDENPEAKFVVIGFDFGAGPAKKLVAQASANGIPVELLVYLEPRGWSVTAIEPNSLVGRVLTIHGTRLWGTPVPMIGSETVLLPNTSRYAVPTHPATLETLTEALSEIAATIPQIIPIQEPIPPLVDPAPTPRPIEVKKTNIEDEWDFLKLASKTRFLSPTSGEPLKPYMPTSLVK